MDVSGQFRFIVTDYADVMTDRLPVLQGGGAPTRFNMSAWFDDTEPWWFPRV